MEIGEVEKWRIKPLREGETIVGFTCGDEDLDDYLMNESGFYQSELLAANYLLKDDNSVLMAFFTLLNDRICIYDFDSSTEFNRFRRRRFIQSKRFKGYPAVKIGRLGASCAYRNNGLGSMLLDFIKIYFIKNKRTGCRFLTVDAYHQAVGFYERNGFVKLNEDHSGNTCLMYYDLLDFKGQL